MLYAKREKIDGKFGPVQFEESDTDLSSNDNVKYLKIENPESFDMGRLDKSKQGISVSEYMSGKTTPDQVNEIEQFSEDTFTEDIFIEDDPKIEDLDKSEQKALFEELDRNMKSAIKEGVKQCGIDSDCTIEIENEDFVIFNNSFGIDPQEAYKFYIKSLGVQHKNPEEK